MNNKSEEKLKEYEKVLKATVFGTRERTPELYYARVGVLAEVSRGLDLLTPLYRTGRFSDEEKLDISEIMYSLNSMLRKYDIG